MNTRPLIAIVLPDLRLGGGQRVLLELAKGFLAADRRVDIVCLVDDGELRSQLPDGVGYNPLTKPGRSSAYLATVALPALANYFRRARPAAVLSSMTGTNLLTSIAHRLSGCRARLVLREASSLYNADSKVLRTLMRLFYARADAIVAVSAGVANGLVALGIKKERVHTVHNPVNANLVRRLAKDGHNLLVKEPYIISIGRLIEQKDQQTLLRAYAESSLRGSHRLILVGEGCERLRLEALIQELGIERQVDLPGTLSNPYPLLAGAALHVLSSRSEGYPNVLLESLALGVPVVATDCPFGPRELLLDGLYGRLVPVGDVTALARAMDEALNTPAESSSEVLGSHDPMEVAEHYIALLDGKL